jgi:D-alanine-D-alanine ligase
VSDTAARYDDQILIEHVVHGREIDVAVLREADGSRCAAVTQAASRMFDALGCAGVARVDFFLTDDGPVLNEVNTMPGMTAESQLPRMFAAAGVPYEELVARVIDAATVPAARPLADEWPKA